MKTSISLTFKVLVFLSCCMMAVAAQEEKEDQRFEAIKSAINQGNKQAMRSLVDVNPSLSIPYLCAFVLDRSTDAERSDTASATLSEIAGHGEYLRQYITNHPKDINLKIRAFKVLSKLKTKEAVKALAYFLNSDKTPAINTEDVSIGSGKTMAASALGEMGLPNPPNIVATDVGRSSQIAKWQEWWTIHQSDYQ